MEAYNSITGTEELVSGRFTGDPKSRGTVGKRKRMQLRQSWEDIQFRSSEEKRKSVLGLGFL
jgi:hypothetical protein